MTECGGEAEVRRVYGFRFIGCGVGCSNPECHVYTGYGMKLYGTEAEAIEAWNTRHDSGCEGCKHSFPICHDPCWECSRYYSDLYNPKEDTDAD